MTMTTVMLYTRCTSVTLICITGRRCAAPAQGVRGQGLRALAAPAMPHAHNTTIPAACPCNHALCDRPCAGPPPQQPRAAPRGPPITPPAHRCAVTARTVGAQPSTQLSRQLLANVLCRATGHAGACMSAVPRLRNPTQIPRRPEELYPPTPTGILQSISIAGATTDDSSAG